MKLTLSLLVVLLVVASCSNEMCACPPYYNPPSAIVWGRVTLNNGAPAPGASIRAAVSEASTPCVQGTMQFVGLVNSQGNYQLAIRREVPPPDSACVFLRAAYPGEAPPIQEAVLGPFILKFAIDPVDTIHVDFELAPVGGASPTR